MTRALLYARYSTAMQSQASVEDQFRLLRQRAEREGWAIAGEHADRAISGTVRERPGLNAALAALDRGEGDVLLAEALDRVSRDQEDLAGIFKRVRFLGARIVTLSEGVVSTMHIGLGGTMSALFLEQLAEKTRRGQIGRVEAGRIPGGLSYGYRAVRQLDARGELERGLREIDEDKAAIVRRIFAEYARGDSPIAIAKRLNTERIASPRGGLWRASTIIGHRQRRNGILNNDLYRGRILFNRQSFRKDPDTRKRVSRPNDAADLVTHDVPELRIIDDELWSEVASRIGSYSQQPAHRRRRPKRLLSGLMRCGCCGGAATIVVADRWGCSNQRQTGTCDNRVTLTDSVAQQRVWDAIGANLLHPDVVAAYLEELRDQLSQTRRRQIAGRAEAERRLAELEVEDSRIVEAIVSGLPVEGFRARAEAIAAERAQLRADLEATDEMAAAAVHPGMIAHYRRRVANLHELVDGDEDLRREGRHLLAELISHVDMTPRADGKRGADLTLHGDLGALLNLGPRNAQKPATPESGGLCTLAMVAGVGFEPTTFRL